MSIQYLDLADLAMIAEAALGVPGPDVAKTMRLDLAEAALHAPAAGFGEVEFYPDLAVKAAVLCVHLVKNHPLPDGNKRLGFVAMIEFLERNGHAWTPPPGDEDGEISAQVILDIAASDVNESTIHDLANWITERIRAPA